MVRSLWSEGDRKPVSSAGDQGGGGGLPEFIDPSGDTTFNQVQLP